MTQVQAPSSSRSPGEDASFEAERERRRRDRTKSPVLDAIAGTVRALSPVSYLLKPRVAQGGPFPDEDPHADGTTSSNGFQSFGALRSSPTNDGRAPSQDLSFLSVTSGADVSTSSDLALGDRSQDSQASDYAFDEEERLMAEMEAKKARVLGGGGELRKFSEGKANGGWFSGLAGFRGGSLEDEDPADTTPKKKKGGANGSEELSAYEPEEEDEDDQEASDHTSDSYDDDSDPEEEPDKPTKTTSHRRRKISDDAKTYKYRPGESASESDISEGGRRRRRRSSGKVSQVAGAEGMVHVVEGKKRRKKGGRGKNTSIEEGEGGELGYEEDESRDGGMDYNPQPSFREEEDSFIVRFHPGADSPPPSSARSRSTTSNKQPSANQSSSQSHSQPSASWNIISTLSDFTVSIARNALVLLIFTFNTIVSLLSWILHKPLDLLNSIRRSFGMADWSKVSKPLGVTLGVLLLASLLGRRSPDSFPLQDLPRGASWRSHLPSISSTSRSSAPSTFIPPESAEELLDRLAHIESTLGAVSKDGQRSTRDVQTLTTKLLGMEKRLDLTDRSMSSLDGKVGTLRTDVASLRDRVKEAERLAKQALDASKVAKIATDTIEEYLPSRLAVKVNPKTKALEVDPSFWTAMREVFVAHQQLPSSISAEVSRQHSTGRAPQTSTSSVVVPRTPTWQEFIDSNEAALSSWSDNKLALQLQAGAVVSRSDFLQVLRSELESAKVEMDERMRGDIQKMGDDVLKKSLAESGLHLDKTVKEAHSKVVVSPAASSASKVDWLGSGDVPSLLTSMIESALLKYSKDTLAMADFALWTAGGRIMPSITSDTFEYAIPRWGGLLKSKIIPGRPPATALHPNINVGECWPFAGSRGQLGILLARRVHVTDITVEHAAREVSFDMAAAPRDIEGAPSLPSTGVEYQSLTNAHLLPFAKSGVSSRVRRTSPGLPTTMPPSKSPNRPRPCRPLPSTSSSAASRTTSTRPSTSRPLLFRRPFRNSRSTSASSSRESTATTARNTPACTGSVRPFRVLISSPD